MDIQARIALANAAATISAAAISKAPADIGAVRIAALVETIYESLVSCVEKGAAKSQDQNATG